MSSIEIKNVDELVRLIQVCVWGFVIFVLMMVLGGIVASMLYSIILVGQPMKSMAPIDTAFTKMLNDIVLILSSSVTTIVSMFAANKGMQMIAEKIAPATTTPPPAVPQAPIPATPSSGMPDFNWMGAAPVQFDEEWRAPPPPTTPADHIDPAAEEIAKERAAAKAES